MNEFIDKRSMAYLCSWFYHRSPKATSLNKGYLPRDNQSETVRIASLEMFSDTDALPHLICSPAVFDAAEVNAPTLDQFLVGLRTAWKAGEVRPTARPKARAKRLRRCPDPLLTVTLHNYEVGLKLSQNELLERLQAEYPGLYPNGLIRTLQRRLKIWRQEMAHRMVFGPMVNQNTDDAATGAFP
jgi:hypothetical protein